MALIHCNFFSDVLGISTAMYVVLPQKTTKQIGMEGKAGGERMKTLTLLHGLSDDHTIWLRRTSIERYAAEYGVAVLMPAGGRGFYTDMAHGPKWYTFFAEELPVIARTFFPLSEKREDNFVAGLSMGGYGAMKLALSRPDQYCAAASLSGALDLYLARRKNASHVPDDETLAIFGDFDRIPGSPNDLFYLLEQCQNSPYKPRLYAACGTEDFLYEENQNFRAACKKAGFDLTYEEGPGGHEWSFWDTYIQRVLAWLPL